VTGEYRAVPSSTSGEPRPANVVDALTRVIRDLPAIARDARVADEHGGYTYRGIDQITAHAAPLLARHGVVFVPQVETVEIRDVMIDQTRWTDTVLTVRYRICGPGGADDALEAVVVGIGRDNADKGANKAMTAAFKYALTEVLCITDQKDDADGERVVANSIGRASRDTIRALGERLRSMPPDAVAAFKAWKHAERFAWPWSEGAVMAMHDKLDELGGGTNAVS